MSGALNAFSGFGQTALSDLTAMSERRGQMALFKDQQVEYDRQINEMNTLVNAELDAQRALVELQQTAMTAMTEAIGIQTEATESLEQFQRESGDLAALATAALESKIGEARAIVDLLAAWITTKPEHSAGGLLTQGTGSGLDLRGWPWATGDIKASYNTAPVGWLKCDGTERRRDEYPELAYLIGSKFGAAGGADFFKLPAKTQLTADAVILADTALQFYIRT